MHALKFLPADMGRPHLAKGLLALAFFSLAAPVALRAQPAAVQQIENSRYSQQNPIFPELPGGTNAPELYQGENADVGPQHILRMAPAHQYFNVLLDSQVFYTDNANFAPSGQKIYSTVFVNTAQAAFVPRDLELGDGKLSSSAGFASQWYNYSNGAMSPFDFDAQTVFAGAKYAWQKWLVGVDLSYTRIVNQPDYHLTYEEVLPAFGLQRFIPLGNSLLVAIGDQVDYHFTDQPGTFATYTDINNRLDNILSLTVTWQMAPNLYFQPIYRFVFTNYRSNTLQNSDRNDYLNLVGISLAYYFNQHFSARTFFNYSAKCSDDPYASAYHETDGGLGVSVNLAF